MQVLLCSMPFGALERQALGLSLLKAALVRDGHPCRLKYFTFPFAELIGLETYQWISRDLPYTAFAGDWSFTEALYGPDASRDAQYIEQILTTEWRIPPEQIASLWDVRRKAPLFLEHCLASVPWDRYQVVGFTSTFEQNIASLALAKRLKAAYPKLCIVFGGANWEGEMGLELHRRFPFVDYACSGEADHSFPELIRRLGRGRKIAGDPVPGLIHRNGHGSKYTGQAAPIHDLDTLPPPDFSDYFADLARSTVQSSILPSILFESSRGCWWGAKSHCTFCGLNGGAMSFRRKSAGATLREISSQLDRYGRFSLEAVDNILDMRYFHDFLPALREAQLGTELFYEVKANLSRMQVKALRDAGVTRLQPGIESMSDRILKLMRKGTTGLRNVQFLKWCREYEVEAEWNILYGFPGETREDYRDMLALLRQLRFLYPPSACGPIRLDRFSPYHHDPASFGMRNIRPMKTYRYLYPFDTESLMRIACYFEFDYDPSQDPSGCANEVIAYCDAWRRYPETGTLWADLHPDHGLLLMDGRGGAAHPRIALKGLEQEAYMFCDELHTLPAILRHLRRKFPEVYIEEPGIRGYLESLVANNLMVTDGSHYLSTALAGPALRGQLEGRAAVPRAETLMPAPQAMMGAPGNDGMSLPVLNA